MYENMNNGWLEVICGSMFSGKSEELIRRVNRAKYGKLSVRSFKPSIDDRYSKESVVSHDGNTTVALPLKNAINIYENIHSADREIDVVAIDEVQFFDRNIIAVVDILANEGKRVICAGLDTDFRGEPFGHMPELMTLAESLTKLTAICPECGSPATRTQRLIDGVPATYDEPVILVGASETYEPRCRHHHHVPGKPPYHFN